MKDGVYKGKNNWRYLLIDNAKGLYFYPCRTLSHNYIEEFMNKETLWSVLEHITLERLENNFIYIDTYENFKRILPLEIL